jgi:hypothetical protein
MAHHNVIVQHLTLVCRSEKAVHKCTLILSATTIVVVTTTTTAVSATTLEADTLPSTIITTKTSTTPRQSGPHLSTHPQTPYTRKAIPTDMEDSFLSDDNNNDDNDARNVGSGGTSNNNNDAVSQATATPANTMASTGATAANTTVLGSAITPLPPLP